MLGLYVYDPCPFPRQVVLSQLTRWAWTVGQTPIFHLGNQGRWGAATHATDRVPHIVELGYMCIYIFIIIIIVIIIVVVINTTIHNDYIII